ncbi:DUF2905 domain-containing protein [Myxococcota bacterium]|nr:DUF2905 domain-containing protein [Myxococcota bacterium]
MDSLAKPLMLLGGLLVAIGLWLHWNPSVPFLGRLPGDVRIERPGFRFDFPIVTCLVLSVALSAVFWVIGRLR